MEINSAAIPGRILLYTLVAVAPAVLSFVVLTLVARTRRWSPWIVPGWVAAAMLAPVSAAYFGVKVIIEAFGAMARDGVGGIGSISAGMWEATQPLLIGSYVACALLVVALVLAIRGPRGEGTARGPIVMAVAILVIAGAALVLTTFLYLGLSGRIVDALDPNLVQTTPLGELSLIIGRRLAATAILSVGMTLALLAAVGITAIIRPKQEPRPAFARVLVLAVALALLGSAANVIALRSWAARLYQTALTGQFSR